MPPPPQTEPQLQQQQEKREEEKWKKKTRTGSMRGTRLVGWRRRLFDFFKKSSPSFLPVFIEEKRSEEKRDER